MRIKISSHDRDYIYTGQYFYGFFGAIILITILIASIRKTYDLVLAGGFLLIWLLIGFFFNRYLIKYIRDAFIDDESLYLTKHNLNEKISLDKIISVEYSGFPPRIISEKFIRIRYFGKNDNIETILIIPTSLDLNKEVKLKMNIRGLIIQRIDNFITKNKIVDNLKST